MAAGVGLAELLVEASLTARWSGAVDDAFELVARAAVVPHLDDDQQALVDHAPGQVLWEAGDMGGALAAYRRAADVIAHDNPLRAGVVAALAHGLMATGQAQEALGVASDAARLASTVGAEREGLHATITGGAALAQLGDVDAAVDALRNCLPRAIRLDDIELVYRCYGNLSFAFGLACRYRELAETAEEAVRTCARYGPVVSLASTVLNNQVTALVHLGRWAEAARLTRAALLDPAAAGVAALLHGGLAEIAVAVGADADADLAAAEQLGSDDPYVVSELAVIKADRAFWRGDPVEAIAVVTAAMPSVAGLDDVTPALELCGAGLRAAADVAALHRFNAVVGVVSELDEMVRQVRRRVRQPLAAALVLLCDAESARARDADDPGVWAVAAATNARLDRPFWHAYCLMRRGAAELHRHARESAALSLAEARDIADALGARPLAGEIATLVRISNVRLAGPAPIDAQKAQVSADRSPAEEFRLTEREAEVLRLWRPARQIGELLGLCSSANARPVSMSAISCADGHRESYPGGTHRGAARPGQRPVTGRRLKNAQLPPCRTAADEQSHLYASEDAARSLCGKPVGAAVAEPQPWQAVPRVREPPAHQDFSARRQRWNHLHRGHRPLRFPRD